MQDAGIHPWQLLNSDGLELSDIPFVITGQLMIPAPGWRDKLIEVPALVVFFLTAYILYYCFPITVIMEHI